MKRYGWGLHALPIRPQQDSTTVTPSPPPPAATPVDVLFIHPPCASPEFPPLGIPVLAAWLRSRGRRVAAVDANALFFHRYPDHATWREGLAFAWTRFQELDDAPSLTYSAAVEYMRLVRLLRLHETHGEAVAAALADDPMPLRKRRALRQIAAMAAFAPAFPETLENGVVEGACRPHASADLVELAGAAERGLPPAAAREMSSPTLPLESFLREVTQEALKAWAPRVIGFSVNIEHQAQHAFHLAALCRALAPDAVTLMGGTFVSCHLAAGNNPALFAWVDGLVVGDGEQPLEALLARLDAMTLAGGASREGSQNACHDGGARRAALQGVPGCVTLTEDSRVTAAPVGRGLGVPLDDAPPPDFSVFDLSLYADETAALRLPLRASRGCSWGRCAFCVTEQAFISRREVADAGAVAEMVAAVMDATGVTRFAFVDDCASPTQLEAVCAQLAAAGRRIRWMASARFSPELTMGRCAALVEGGCQQLVLGLECASPRLFELVRKGVDEALVWRYLSNMRWAGLSATANMIVGLPTETEAEARAGFARLDALRREGALAGLAYSPFLLLEDSAMGRDPAGWGVSCEPLPRALDLAPPRHEFRQPGMTPARARALAAEFNAHGSRFAGAAAAPPRELGHDGARRVIRRDLATIREILGGFFETRHSFVEQLACGDARLGVVSRLKSSTESKGTA